MFFYKISVLCIVLLLLFSCVQNGDCGDQCCSLDFVVLINYLVTESNIATDQVCR